MTQFRCTRLHTTHIDTHMSIHVHTHTQCRVLQQYWCLCSCVCVSDDGIRCRQCLNETRRDNKQCVRGTHVIMTFARAFGAELILCICFVSHGVRTHRHTDVVHQRHTLIRFFFLFNCCLRDRRLQQRLNEKKTRRGGHTSCVCEGQFNKESIFLQIIRV